jgi:hypothetical protein
MANCTTQDVGATPPHGSANPQDFPANEKTWLWRPARLAVFSIPPRPKSQ